MTLLSLANDDASRQEITTAASIQYRLTSFFFRFLTGSCVSRSGDAAVPAARFLALIAIFVQRGRRRFRSVLDTENYGPHLSCGIAGRCRKV
jgi:hypothetical protein